MRFYISLFIALLGIACAHQQPLQTTVDGVPVIYLTQPPAKPKTQLPPNTYKVRKGDTIFSIARRFNIDYERLAQANNIGENYIILPGQILQLTQKTEPASELSLRPEQTAIKQNAPAATTESPLDMIWPMDKKISLTDAKDRPGIYISSSEDAYIIAAATGQVVYAGEELENYGKMILVSHKNKFLTVYAHSAEILIEEGQTVRRGERIARPQVTSQGNGWYFEVRRDGKTVDPFSLLPKNESF